MVNRGLPELFVCSLRQAHGEPHLIIAQAAAATLAGVLCNCIARSPHAANSLACHLYINPRISRFRGPYALCSSLWR